MGIEDAVFALDPLWTMLTLVLFSFPFWPSVRIFYFQFQFQLSFFIYSVLCLSGASDDLRQRPLR